jgi:hypothetical protein
MGRMLRPKLQVVPDSSLVGDAATHIVRGDQPYFWKKPTKKSEPAGTLPAGSQVTVLSKGTGDTAVVRDAEGRYLFLAASALSPID